MKILFVCMGNICRSPTAEAVFRHKLEAQGLSARFSHDSCGTIGYHVGSPPDERATQAAEKRGYKMADLRARELSKDDLDQFDLLLAMDKSNFDHILEMASPGQQAKVRLMLSYGSSNAVEVPDPYYGGRKGFEHVLDLLEDACDDLLSRLQKGTALND